MCGIIGISAQRPVADNLLDGLKRLEYRGYDSSGMAVAVSDRFAVLKAVGKVGSLEEKLRRQPVTGVCGIAHTRWATHGVPSENNAHPHLSQDGRIVLVHNGIIENYAQLRTGLSNVRLTSDTDSAVVVECLSQLCKRGLSLLNAVQELVPHLDGAYAFAILDQENPGEILGLRKGSPLVVGLGSGANYLASDTLALGTTTDRFIYLEEGEITIVRNDSVRLLTSNGTPCDITPRICTVPQQEDLNDKGDYAYFMRKEIDEQARAIADTISGKYSANNILPTSWGHDLHTRLADIQQIHCVACGTSYYAARIAAYWFEKIAAIGCSVDIASEYRYRAVTVPQKCLLITVSQSGETADTLAALSRWGKSYAACLAICNVAGSSLMRESEYAIQTLAGAEIGVASTKAFTTQLAVFYLLALSIAKVRGRLQPEEEAQYVKNISTTAEVLSQVIACEQQIVAIAERLKNYKNAIFLGRGVGYPIAEEAALKLKELAYIHAEAYPGGELKHGPLALIDASMPTIAVLFNDNLADKMLSNLQEIRARKGMLIVFHDQRINLPKGLTDANIALPAVDADIAPLVYTPAFQLLAYHTALLLGKDIDQPRNLAKSVTVE